MYKILRDEESEDVTVDVVQALFAIASFYEDKATYDKDLEPATTGQRTIFACSWYISEVQNGGHQQFFLNPTGMVWQDALEGFRQLGADPFARILEKATSMFPNKRPAFDEEEREAQLENVDLDELGELDKSLYAILESLWQYVDNYVQENPNEFFLE